MLIPQYTIRWLLAVTTACAAAFSIFALALQGSQWALGVSIAIVSLVVVLLVHGFVFALLWLFSVVISLFCGRPAGFGRPPFVHDPTSPPPKSPLPSAGHTHAPPDEQAASDKEVPETPILLEEPHVSGPAGGQPRG